VFWKICRAVEPGESVYPYVFFLPRPSPFRLPVIQRIRNRKAGGPGARILKIDGETVGAVLRTRDRIRPLFGSPGRLIDSDDSVRIVLRTCAKVRIPEPLRRADR
jgi:deoxyinosine 3'endonuclease (endonuclease V)